MQKKLQETTITARTRFSFLVVLRQLASGPNVAILQGQGSIIRVFVPKLKMSEDVEKLRPDYQRNELNFHPIFFF